LYSNYCGPKVLGIEAVLTDDRGKCKPLVAVTPAQAGRKIQKGQVNNKGVEKCFVIDHMADSY
jgi:hypothetical protein